MRASRKTGVQKRCSVLRQWPRCLLSSASSFASTSSISSYKQSSHFVLKALLLLLSAASASACRDVGPNRMFEPQAWPHPSSFSCVWTLASDMIGVLSKRHNWLEVL